MANANQNALNTGLDSILTAASYRLMKPLAARNYVARALSNPNFEYIQTVHAWSSIHERLDSLLKVMNSETRDSRLVEAANQILPSDGRESHVNQGEFYLFAQNNRLAVSGLAYRVADKLKKLPKISKQLRDYYEAHARDLLEKVDDTQKVVIYATISVTKKIAAERYAEASAFEKGLIEVYFPKMDKPGFESHLKALSPEARGKINMDGTLFMPHLLLGAGFNIGDLAE